jgi:hypothetical protein
VKIYYALCSVALSWLLRFYENLKCVGFGRCAEYLVGVDDFVEFEPMRDELFGIDPMRLHGLKKHRRGAVSTSPVVIAMLRSHKRSRCKSAFTPWTPILAMMPPGATYLRR